METLALSVPELLALALRLAACAAVPLATRDEVPSEALARPLALSAENMLAVGKGVCVALSLSLGLAEGEEVTLGEAVKPGDGVSEAVGAGECELDTVGSGERVGAGERDTAPLAKEDRDMEGEGLEEPLRLLLPVAEGERLAELHSVANGEAVPVALAVVEATRLRVSLGLAQAAGVAEESGPLAVALPAVDAEGESVAGKVSVAGGVGVPPAWRVRVPRGDAEVLPLALKVSKKLREGVGDRVAAAETGAVLVPAALTDCEVEEEAVPVSAAEGVARTVFTAEAVAKVGKEDGVAVWLTVPHDVALALALMEPMAVPDWVTVPLAEALRVLKDEAVAAGVKLLLALAGELRDVRGESEERVEAEAESEPREEVLGALLALASTVTLADGEAAAVAEAEAEGSLEAEVEVEKVREVVGLLLAVGVGERIGEREGEPDPAPEALALGEADGGGVANGVTVPEADGVKARVPCEALTQLLGETLGVVERLRLVETVLAREGVLLELGVGNAVGKVEKLACWDLLVSAVSEADCEGVGEEEVQREGAGDSVASRVTVNEAVPESKDTLALNEGWGVPEAHRVLDAVTLAVLLEEEEGTSERVGDTEALADSEAETEEVADSRLLPEALSVGTSDSTPERVEVAAAVGVPPAWLAVPEMELDRDAQAVGTWTLGMVERETEADCEFDGVAEALSERASVPRAVPVETALALGGTETEAGRDAALDALRDGCSEGAAAGVLLALALRTTGELDTVLVAQALCEASALGDGDSAPVGVALCAGLPVGRAVAERCAEGEEAAEALSSGALAVAGAVSDATLEASGEALKPREVVALPVAAEEGGAGALALAQPEMLALPEPEREPVVLGVGEGVPVEVWVGVGETVLLLVGVGVADSVAEGVAVGVQVAEVVGVYVSLGETVPDALGVTEGEAEGVALGVSDGVAVAVSVVEGVGVNVLLGETVPDTLGVPEGVRLGVGLRLGLLLGVAVPEGLALGVPVSVAAGDSLGVCEGVSLAVALPLLLPLEVSVAVGDGVGVAGGLGVAEAVGLAD